MSFRDCYLRTVAQQVYEGQRGDLDGVVFVLPSQVAAYDLRQQLAPLLKAPIWSPPTLLWRTFLQSLAPQAFPSEEVLLSHLHQVVIASKDRPTSFGDFESWGRWFLHDLDLMMHALVDPALLFARDVPEGKKEAKERVTEFWRHMRGRGDNLQKRFCASWDALQGIYKRFCAVLEQHGLVLEADYYKTLHRRLVKGDITPLYKRVVCVGQEGLTPLVMQVFKAINTLIPVDWYDDGIDALMAASEGQKSIPQAAFRDLMTKKEKRLTLMPSKTALGQTGLVAQQIVDLISQKGIEVCQHISIILADDGLLIPLLHAFPPHVPLHIKVRYRLAYTPVYALLSDVLACYEDWGVAPPELILPQVKKLAQHPYLNLDAAGMALLSQWLKGGRPRKKTEGGLPPSWIALFKLLEGKKTACDVWRGIRLFLQAVTDRKPPNRADWEDVSLQKALEVCEGFERAGLCVKTSASGRFFRFFSHKLSQVSLPVGSGHRQGVVVVAHTQAAYLDKRYVFMLSMNEGVFPRHAEPPSLVPLTLRKAYGLPGLQAQQASDGAFFYRLIKQSKQVYACYHQAAGHTPSRFLLPFCDNETSSDRESDGVVVPAIPPIVVEKEKGMMRALHNLLGMEGSNRLLTPSPLNVYMDCRLRFFFQYIARLRTEIEKDPTIAPAVLGNMLHEILRALYHDAVGQQVTAALLDNIGRQVPQVVKRVMKNCHDANPEAFQISTQPFIANILSSWAGQVILQDKKRAPFQLIGLEFGGGGVLKRHLTLEDGRKVALGGIIDRIDQQGSKVRVLDYKTGSFQPHLDAIEAVFDRHRTDRNKIALQLLWYGWLYRPVISEGLSCQPTVMSMRDIFTATPKTMLMLSEKEKCQPISSIASHEATFEGGLRTVIQELLDPKQPFDQTQNLAHCSQCPYRAICLR